MSGQQQPTPGGSGLNSGAASQQSLSQRLSASQPANVLQSMGQPAPQHFGQDFVNAGLLDDEQKSQSSLAQGSLRSSR